MDVIMKAKWLEALRSGQYKQAQQFLRTDKGFCCLGVLCDLDAKETGTQWNAGVDGRQHYRGKSIFLPPSVKVKYALNNENVVTELMRMNDAGSTFVEIADVIEKEL